MRQGTIRGLFMAKAGIASQLGTHMANCSRSIRSLNR